MKNVSGCLRRIVARLLVSCLCCLALNPVIGAEEVADVLLAKHGKDALVYYLRDVYTNEQDVATLGTVEYLVAKGADAGAKDEAGLTPLEQAVANKNTEVVKYFESLP